jgi:hypothetical protein
MFDEQVEQPPRVEGIIHPPPKEHLDIARRGIEAYNRGDLDAIFELVTDDVEFVQHGRGRGSGIETRMPAAHLVRFRDWLLCGWRLWRDQRGGTAPSAYLVPTRGWQARLAM